MSYSELAIAASGDAAAPLPDIHELFAHYNEVYFRDALGACLVSWSSAPPMKRCTGTCDCDSEGGCEIRLSEPLLGDRSANELKNTLLHEMIHAFMWIKNGNKDHSDHTEAFHALMDAINYSTLLDCQKPLVGYSINVNHKFTKEADNSQANHWTCESCGHSFSRTARGEPSANDCISNVKQDTYCGYPICQWHRHRKYCSGRFIQKQAEVCQYKNAITIYTDPDLQKNKFKGIHYTRSSARRSRNKPKMDEDMEGSKAIAIKNSPSAGDANRNPGCKPSGNGSRREQMFEDSEGNLPIVQCQNMVPAGPKRTRTPVPKLKNDSITIKNTPSSSNLKRNSGSRPSGVISQKEHKTLDSKGSLLTEQCLTLVPTTAKRKMPSSSRKKPMHNGGKRKRCSERNAYNVIIKWLDLYTDEEDEENEVPLINRRTEERNKRLLLEQAKEQELKLTASKEEMAVLSSDKMEECKVPKNMVITQGPENIKAHEEDIVYISD